jgi:hypothetical protein
MQHLWLFERAHSLKINPACGGVVVFERMAMWRKQGHHSSGTGG